MHGVFLDKIRGESKYPGLVLHQQSWELPFFNYSTSADGTATSFTVDDRIDTPQEVDYYRHGGILHYVSRQLAS